MYTSAPNNLSELQIRVCIFSKRGIELYCGCPNIYDKVLHRNNVMAKISRCGATIKDLGNVLLTNQQRKILGGTDSLNKRKLNHMVNKLTHNIIMIDDKPKNIRIRSGRAIGILPYEYECNSVLFKNVLIFVSNLRKKLEFYRDPENVKQFLGISGYFTSKADMNHKKYYAKKYV